METPEPHNAQIISAGYLCWFISAGYLCWLSLLAERVLAERVLAVCSAVTTSMPLWCRYYDTKVASMLLARWCGTSVTAGYGAHVVRGARRTVCECSLGRGTPERG